MSFAPVSKDNSHEPYLSEKDLLQQLASTYTKREMHGEKDDGEASRASVDLMMTKSKFNAHLKTLGKLWQAFSKYIKNQVQEKQRSVDTTIFGVFMKDGDKLRFLASPEYLEAGKFRLPRDVLKEKGSEDYSKFYEKITGCQEGEMPVLNFGAIAIVSGLKADKAQTYLTDLFALLIENSRKTTKEVRMSFGSFGELILYRNGELGFNFRSSSDYSDTKSLTDLRNQAREEDMSSVIDRASAILSQGGGKTFSVRSSFWGNLSITTPKSTTSTRNAFQPQAQRWTKYTSRSKQPQPKAPSDIFASTTPSVKRHQLIPHDDFHDYASQAESRKLSQRVPVPSQCDQPNLALREASAVQSSKASDSRAQSESGGRQLLTFPYLEAFLERRKGGGKKQRFLYQPQVQVTQYNTQQVADKYNKGIIDKVGEIIEERRQLKEMQSRMAELGQAEKMLRRYRLQETTQTNLQLVSQKQELEKRSRIDEASERLNYFPFTHGDSIEAQRSKIYEAQRNEWKVLNATKAAQDERAQRDREERNVKLQALTELREQLMAEERKYRYLREQEKLQQQVYSEAQAEEPDLASMLRQKLEQQSPTAAKSEVLLQAEDAEPAVANELVQTQ